MKQLIRIVACSLIGISTILLFFFYSKSANLSKNNFIRFFPPHLVSNFRSLDLAYNSYYIVGASNNYIYLSNQIATNNLLIVNHNLKDTLHFKLTPSKDLKIAWQKVKLLVDSPFIYLMEGVTPTVLRTSLYSTSHFEKFDFERIFFASTVPISNYSFVSITYNNKLKKSILSKVTISGKLYNANDILDKQVDGKICEDGNLLFDKSTNNIIFVYTFRNQFISLDTNLNVIYRSKTIDTNSIAKIRLDTIHSENKVTFSSPPLIVNKNSCLSNNKLFVLSNLKADNQDTKSFNNSSFIDIYDLKTGNYNYSLPLSNYRDKHIKQIFVANNKLIALSDKYLTIYDLKLN